MIKITISSDKADEDVRFLTNFIMRELRRKGVYIKTKDDFKMYEYPIHEFAGRPEIFLEEKIKKTKP